MLQTYPMVICWYKSKRTMKQFLCFALFATLVCAIGCSKTSSKPASVNTDSTNTGGGTGGTGGTGGKSTLTFAGNEYTGVMTELSRYWAKPFVVDFNADSTVNVFCDFYLVANNHAFNDDSLHGKIFKIGSGVGGGLLVDVSYPDIADTQEYTFTADLSGLTGGSVGAESGGLASNQFIFSGATLFTKPGVSMVNTEWYTDTIVSTDATNGLPEFPDVNNITFFNTYTEYYRLPVGLVTVGVIPDDSVLKVDYRQINARVNFFGYDEVTNKLIAYFGVLSNDGNTMLVDINASAFPYARVPTPQQTIDWYGPPETTPIMHRLKN
jgi:hypothetical protein